MPRAIPHPNHNACMLNGSGWIKQLRACNPDRLQFQA
jgi:hypothetical protein